MSPNSKPHNPIKRPPRLAGTERKQMRPPTAARAQRGSSTVWSSAFRRPGALAHPNRVNAELQTVAGRKCAPAGSRRAFTLIELIGVMTVGVILALALATVAIKHLDQIAADKETTQLKTFADAFRLGVIRGKIIPKENAWDQVIATNLGLSISQVRTNDRRLARVFLIDPALRIGQGYWDGAANANNTLTYTQDKSPPGSQITDSSGNNVIAPYSPRVMILSSLSKSLPVVSGVTNTTTFNNIWNAAEGTLPVTISGGPPWSGWGKADDLKIQRIHLSDSFVQVVFNNQDRDNQMRFDIDVVGLSDWVQPTNTVSRFFLDSTLLTLYGTNGLVQHKEILHESKSFVSENGSWKAGGYVGITIHHPSPLDLQMTADAMLQVGRNPGANTYYPSNVYNALITYMADYVAWADAGFPTNSGVTVYDNLARSGGA